jgi:hypothetical protein
MEACTKIGGPTVVALAARHRLVHQRLACKNDAIVAQSVYSFIGRGGGQLIVLSIGFLTCNTCHDLEPRSSCKETHPPSF